MTSRRPETDRTPGGTAPQTANAGRRTVGISLVGDGNLYQARPGGFVSDLVEVTSVALPGVLLLPAYRRVGFRKRDCVFFLLLPVWGYVITWKAGFRLTSLPYRDWPPRPDEDPRCRRIHGSPYHVVPGAPGGRRGWESALVLGAGAARRLSG